MGPSFGKTKAKLSNFIKLISCQGAEQGREVESQVIQRLFGDIFPRSQETELDGSGLGAEDSHSGVCKWVNCARRLLRSFPAPGLSPYGK